MKMSICSQHREPDAACSLCQADIRDLLPDFDRKVAEAEAAGQQTCAACGFVYYRTTWECPLCGFGRAGVRVYQR